MSTKRLAHLKEGEEVYLKVRRRFHKRDDNQGLGFGISGSFLWLNDSDDIYTLNELREKIGCSKKIELTLAEVEERLGLDAGSLTIK